MDGPPWILSGAFSSLFPCVLQWTSEDCEHRAMDIISLAWIENYDSAVLVSSDQDLVPSAGFLETRGIKVIHSNLGCATAAHPAAS